MAVLDIPSPAGAIAPLDTIDARPSIAVAGTRFSSPHAQPLHADGSADRTAHFAAEVGASERGLRAAEGMIRRHLASAGDGRAGAITATLEGVRRAQVIAPGLVVVGRGDEPSFGIALIADPLVLLVVVTPQEALHWSLLPGGPSVTARADALRLVRSLAAGGELNLRLGSREAFPPLVVDGGEWRDEDEWRLFEDLAVVEEWSGVTLPMPDDTVSPTEATATAQAASWARTQQIDARVNGPIVFSAGADLDAASIDELRIHQDFEIHLAGMWISMGEGTARVGLERVEQENPAARTYEALPAGPSVGFSLSPPAGRRLPPVRTQPERVPPPTVRSATEPPPRRDFRRPARRVLAEVLAARADLPIPSVGPRGTVGLLEDVRGE